MVEIQKASRRRFAFCALCINRRNRCGRVGHRTLCRGSSSCRSPNCRSSGCASLTLLETLCSASNLDNASTSDRLMQSPFDRSTDPGMEKGEPCPHGSPFGAYRLTARADHATNDSPVPASCGCSPLSMNGMIEKVCPPRCSSFCTALTRRSPSGVLISSDR